MKVQNLNLTSIISNLNKEDINKAREQIKNMKKDLVYAGPLNMLAFKQK